ncbi:MAG: 50S ribosomal protein L11 methyltransferase [Bdellovibrionales bacterium]
MPNQNKILWNAVIVSDPGSIEFFAECIGDDALAVTILAPPRKDEARVEALFAEKPDRTALTARLAVVAGMHGARTPILNIYQTPQIDWIAKVSGDFPPLPIARWTVFGAQHRAAVRRPRGAMQIDATSAFGTGEHPTTRGCLIMLDWLLKRAFKGCNALDVGCGSGILAMAWAQAMRKPALGIDMDAQSVEIARNNVRVNGLQKEIHTVLGRGYNHPAIREAGPYDLIMANIFAGPLCHLAKDLKRHLRPGGAAILSGILRSQANAVLAAHRMQGLRLKRRLDIGEWSVLALEHRPRAK